MNILIVFSHPSNKSFTYQVLEKVKEGLEDSGHETEVSDLYAMNFQSDMTEEEYYREGFSKCNLPIPEDVRFEQEKIAKADVLIFIYPVWWSDCPAKLKGWFDRVYTVGYAYGYDENGQKARKMKTVKYGLILCTAGHPNDFLDSVGLSESMKNIMLEDRLGIRFEKKEMIILGGTLDLEKVRDKHLETAYQAGKEINTHFD